MMNQRAYLLWLKECDKCSNYNLQTLYESILENGDIAIDIGAQVGRHTIPLALSVGPRGKVFALEPIPKCQRILIKNATRYLPSPDIVNILPFAASGYDGESEFFVALNHWGYSALKMHKNYDLPINFRKIVVQVKKIDSLFSRLPRIDFIKIDAEGEECRILEGAKECIRKFRPTVAFEFSRGPTAPYPTEADDMAAFWNLHSYKIYDIGGRCLTMADLAQSKLWDFFAIPAENKILQGAVTYAISRFIPV